MNQETIISILGLILSISTILYGVKLRIAAKRIRETSARQMVYKANLQRDFKLLEFVIKSSERQTHRQPIQRQLIGEHLVVEHLEEHVEEVYE